jgi:DNA-binding MarR family transcriptional regulator
MMSEVRLLSEYVESIALHFETSGLPRIAGRILGMLLTCHPSDLGAAELETRLGASKASISTMTRLLEQYGLIERTARPGERITRYRIRDHAWTELMKSKLQGLSSFRILAERGLQLLENAPPEQRARLETMQRLYTFFEAEIPALIQRLETAMNSADETGRAS